MLATRSYPKRLICPDPEPAVSRIDPPSTRAYGNALMSVRTAMLPTSPSALSK